MSTRSLVGIPLNDGVKGRYVHSDGYPTWQARQLRDLVQRDGVEKVIDTVINKHGGWSSLKADQPDVSAITLPPGTDYADVEYGTPEYVAFMFSRKGMYGDGRFLNVPGYGVAYSTKKVKMHGETVQQTTLEEWNECHCPDDPEHCDPVFLEWAYSLSPSGLAVLVSADLGAGRTRTFANGKSLTETSIHVLVDVLPWDASDEDIAAIEDKGNKISEDAYEAKKANA